MIAFENQLRKGGITFSATQMFVRMCVCSFAESCLTLCDPMDCNPRGFSVYGIFQARALDVFPFPTPGNLPEPGIKPASPPCASWIGR